MVMMEGSNLTTDYRRFNRSRFNAKSLVHQTAVKMLMFADDCALLTTSEEELQRLTTAFGTTAAKFGLVINIAKTFSLFQTVFSDHRHTPNIKIGDQIISNYSDFRYLGSTLTEDLSIDKELRHRHHVRYLDRFHLNFLRRIIGIKCQDRIPDTEVLRRASSTGMGAT